ncbi:Putative ribonuclease H protein At1g65750 [Linum grandiflorum]
MPFRLMPCKLRCFLLIFAKTIDQRICNFVWGSLPGGRKPHLVSWDDLCRPKDQGGLGLRKAKELNDAFSKRNTFWVKFLGAKYLRDGQLDVGNFRKCPCSALWRGIRRVWDHVNKGTKVCVKGGRNTRFWYDSWIDGGICLADTLSASAFERYAHWKVRDAVTPMGDWNWAIIHTILPIHARRLFAGMLSPSEEGEDEVMWGLDLKGHFTLKSAYVCPT